MSKTQSETTQITSEQAFTNIVAVCEKFVGTKAEHILVEKSLIKLKEELFPKNEAEKSN
jgi:hypothetical protein